MRLYFYTVLCPESLLVVLLISQFKAFATVHLHSAHNALYLSIAFFLCFGQSVALLLLAQGHNP